MDVANFLCTFVGSLNSFDHVTFLLLCALEMHQIRWVLGLISIMCSFLIGNKKFEQAHNLAQWNIKGWSGVGLGDVCNASAIGKPSSLY